MSKEVASLLRAIRSESSTVIGFLEAVDNKGKSAPLARMDRILSYCDKGMEALIAEVKAKKVDAPTKPEPKPEPVANSNQEPEPWQSRTYKKNRKSKHKDTWPLVEKDHFEEGLSYEQLANKYGIPRSSVATHLWRIKRIRKSEGKPIATPESADLLPEEMQGNYNPARETVIKCLKRVKGHQTLVVEFYVDGKWYRGTIFKSQWPEKTARHHATHNKTGWWILPEKLVPSSTYHKPIAKPSV